MSTHYPDFKPILDYIIGTFFILGFLIALFFSKNKFLKIICLLALILPFTHSAITDIINSDQRLTPFFPLIAIITGYGIKTIFSKTQKILKLKNIYILFLQAVLAIYILSQGLMFFWKESASKQYNSQDYLSMYTVYYLKKGVEYQKSQKVCLFVSPTNFQYFNLLHVQEQYQYFIPYKYFYVYQDPTIKGNEIYVSKNCNYPLSKNDFVANQYCTKPTKFVCPKSTSLTLFIESPHTEKQKNQGSTYPNFLLIPPTPLFIP